MILTRFVFCSLLLIVAHTGLLAQAMIEFKTSPKLQPQLTTQFSEYSVHQLPDKFNLLPNSTQEAEVTLEFGAHQFEVSLKKTIILTEQYKAFALSPNQTKTQVFIDVQTYEGHLKGHPDKTVKLTTSDQFIYGFITGHSETYYIEPLNRFDAKTANQVVLYPASAVTLSNTKCAVSEQQTISQQLKRHPDLVIGPEEKSSFCKEVHLAIIHDYSMFQKYSENIETLFAYTIGILNNVQTNFNAPFNGNLEFRIAEQLVPICSGCDPWTTSTDPGVLLLDFLMWGNQQNLVNNFHIGQFWTNRDLDGSTVGYAYVGATCSPFNYQLIQDFSTNANQMRMVVAHELGHNLNAQHNFISTGNIMDPVVSTATTWTTQSIAAMTAYIGGLTCLNGCQADYCPPVSNLVINSNQQATWSASPGKQFKVEVIDKSTEAVIYQQVQQQNYFNMGSVIELCSDYMLKITTVCPTSESQPFSTFLQSSFTSKFAVNKTEILNCNNGFYDLELELSYVNGNTGNFIVEAGGNNHYFDYTVSPQTITINNLVSNGMVNLPISIYDAQSGPSNCQGETSIDAPDALCNFQFVEPFDDCELPAGWQIGNSVDSMINWQFGDANRPVTNYPQGTIDGTCMAYFDDDLAVSTTGTLILESPAFDLTNYENIQLQFDYDFHSFSGGLKPSPHDYNNSSFSVEVWNGISWVNAFTHQGVDQCLFNQFWSCPPPPAVVNLEPYKNSALKIRFVYDDDGKWTGAVGIDNFKVTGSLNCGNYNQPLQTTTTQQADTECTDDSGWTHFWNSADPSTILLSIYKNNDPTFNVTPANVETGIDMNDQVLLIPNSIPYVQHHDGFNVLSRFWNVAPLQQPTNPVSVRFYYTAQELQLLLDQTGLDVKTDLTWFKFTTNSGVDPNPAKGHLEAHPQDFVTLQPAFGMLGNIPYAEFTVESFSGGGVGGYESNLPVELVEFTGVAEERSIVLEWFTQTEQNSDQFIVQRSTDGVEFNTIGSVKAAGNSITTKQYQLLDRQPVLGMNYYRLQQIDLDGSSVYSNVIAVRFSKGKGFSVLSANPGANPFVLGVDWNRNETATVYITGVDGRQLLSEPVSLKPGFNRVELNAERLGTGSYFIHLEGNGFVEAVKVVKVE